MLRPVTTRSSVPSTHEHEQRAGDVEADHQHREALQRVHAGLADDRGHRAERADRRRPHDHRQHPEDQLLEWPTPRSDRLPGRPMRLHREADQQRDQQRLTAPRRRPAGRTAWSG